MKARLPESLLGRGTNAHPVHRTSEASVSGNHLEPAGLECPMRATLDVCVLFASTTAKKHGLCSRRATDSARRGFLTGETFAKSDASEISDSALSVISGRVSHRIIRYITVSCRRIDEAVAVPFYIHRLKK